MKNEVENYHSIFWWSTMVMILVLAFVLISVGSISVFRFYLEKIGAEVRAET
jgi:hypothetical protein